LNVKDKVQNTFALVVNFIDESWMPKHVIVGLFDAPNITKTTLAKLVKPLFAQFN
jgi:hypothetical protein